MPLSRFYYVTIFLDDCIIKKKKKIAIDELQLSFKEDTKLLTFFFLCQWCQGMHHHHHSLEKEPNTKELSSKTVKRLCMLVVWSLQLFYLSSVLFTTI